MSEHNPLTTLSFPTAPHESITPDPHNTYYAGKLRESFLIGANVVFDPDIALDADPESYRKMVAELSIAAKLRKRSLRVVSAQWRIHSEDQDKLGLCKLLTDIFKRIIRFRLSLQSLIYNANLTGFSTSRIFGEFQNTQLKGDNTVRRWWLPTNLVDVSKQRWRIHKEDPAQVEMGYPPYFWSIQDILTYMWHRVDGPDATPGLRRMDYVWARSGEDEQDMGYAHGMGRGLFHKWFMLTHMWLYAHDGAESWAKGKIVIKHPNELGGITLPGTTGIESVRQSAAIKQAVADAAAKQLSRHVLVIDSTQEYEVLGRPETGHESVKWPIEKIDEELDEFILGIKKGELRPWDIDPEIVNADKNILEDAINDDLMRAIVLWNEQNFRNLGWEPEDVLQCVWLLQRDAGYNPEVLGKSIQIALAAGVPVHRDDVYKGLGLTPVNPGDPDAVWAPQAGQPMNVSLRKPGEGVDDYPTNPDGSAKPSSSIGAPSPGGPPAVQTDKDLQIHL